MKDLRKQLQDLLNDIVQAQYTVPSPGILPKKLREWEISIAYLLADLTNHAEIPNDSSVVKKLLDLERYAQASETGQLLRALGALIDADMDYDWAKDQFTTLRYDEGLTETELKKEKAVKQIYAAATSARSVAMQNALIALRLFAN